MHVSLQFESIYIYISIHPLSLSLSLSLSISLSSHFQIRAHSETAGLIASTARWRHAARNDRSTATMQLAAGAGRKRRVFAPSASRFTHRAVVSFPFAPGCAVSRARILS